MRLNGTSAVVYGASNPTGASVAQGLANDGASVYLAGRSTSLLQPVAGKILDSGGAVEVARVDPMNPKSVSEHLHRIAVEHGSVDLSVNLAFLTLEGPARLCNLTDEQFAAAAFTRLRSNFVTMSAAASEMAYQGRGVILATGVPGRASTVFKGAGPAIGSAAIEALCDQLRIDVGSFGVRIGYLVEVPASDEELMGELHRLLVAASNVPPVPRGIPRPTGDPTGLSWTEARTGAATG